MVPWEIEQAVFDLEEVRIVVRALPKTTLGKYQYDRKAANNASVSEWLQKRVYPITGGHDVVVIDGTGRIAHGKMKMETLRASYAA